MTGGGVVPLFKDDVLRFIADLIHLFDQSFPLCVAESGKNLFLFKHFRNSGKLFRVNVFGHSFPFIKTCTYL